MSDLNPFYNKLTKPIRDGYLNSILKGIDFEKAYPYDKKFNFEERLSPKLKFIGAWEKWILTTLVGVKEYKFKYIANGNTDSLNQIILNFKPTCIYGINNDYSYYKFLADNLNIPYKNLTVSNITEIKTTDLICLSIPDSYTGEIVDRLNLIKTIQQNNLTIYIDIAYLGISEPYVIDLLNTENSIIAFSFSKTLSLSFNRISLCYANRQIQTLDIMNKVGYLNLHGINSAMLLMEKVSYDYMYRAYQDQYKEICLKLNLQPTKCILFGHDTQKNKFCISENYITKSSP